MVDVSNSFFKLFKNNSSFDNSLNFLNSFIFISNLNDFFIFSYNLFDSFHNNWNFDNFLNNVLNVFVNVNKLRNNTFDLDYLWYFDDSLLKSFNFVDLWNDN